ncbi:matrix metalloproteinase-24-like [Prorops nasuta]|uniref:matrix metalloproteinase-24-like n=1 Tax=Prorops nasuta TaxID=863751 RepID=UPI0034CED181
MNFLRKFTVISIFSLWVVFCDNNNNSTFISNYLTKYGYIDDGNFNNNNGLTLNAADNEIYKHGLRVFKQNFNLAEDSTTEEIIDLMQRPRCGLGDFSQNNDLEENRWYKKELSWYFHVASIPHLETAHEVFNQWSIATNLTFKEVQEKSKADIIISFQSVNHNFVYDSTKCDAKLGGQVVGHAFFPDKLQQGKEIHLYMDKKQWFFGLGPYNSHFNSLYWILMHEVGHSLGLHHDISGHIMHPYVQHHNTTNGSPFNTVDLNNINNLYNSGEGVKNSPMIPTATNGDVTPRRKKTFTTINPTSDKTPQSDEEDVVNFNTICQLPASDFLYFIHSKRLFVIYKQWFWSFDMNSKEFKNPQLIKNWLQFLPSDFKSIKAIHEVSLDEIAVYSNNYVYVFNAKSLKLINGYPETYQQLFGSEVPYDGIQAAI